MSDFDNTQSVNSNEDSQLETAPVNTADLQSVVEEIKKKLDAVNLNLGRLLLQEVAASDPSVKRSHRNTINRLKKERQEYTTTYEDILSVIQPVPVAHTATNNHPSNPPSNGSQPPLSKASILVPHDLPTFRKNNESVKSIHQFLQMFEITLETHGMSLEDNWKLL